MSTCAADGDLELFKVTAQYDLKKGREQDHFPTRAKTAALT
jgi:hypothetical protein